MRFHALATDYDGTIAHQGGVDATTLAALQQWKKSGRTLILVTGRELQELLRAFPSAAMFDRIVAENGAVIYRPDSEEEVPLVKPPPGEFAERLRQRGVQNLSVGRVIVSTHEPFETVVLEVIRDLGLELQVIFNKGSVMVLPSGCNKATGLQAALHELGLSPFNVIGVGDAENDHALLDLCGCAVAVANALPALQDKADLVTTGEHGAGVTELIARVLNDELQSLNSLSRHDLALGADAEDNAVHLRAVGGAVLVAGSSGAGKSTLTNALLERLNERNFQCLVIDPEGDYLDMEGVLVLGTPKQPPVVDELLTALQRPSQSVVANLVAIPLEDKPPFFCALFTRLTEMRSKLGRPHWLLVDEAHHVLPASWKPPPDFLPEQLKNTVFVTVEPSHVSPAVLRQVDLVLAIGATPGKTLRSFATTVDRTGPTAGLEPLARGEALIWSVDSRAARRFHYTAPRTVRRRHVRKYAQGELPEEHCFVFEGPARKLRLRAQNLQRFLELGDGVDDETWAFHLARGDYSRWLQRSIKDEDLARAVAVLERKAGLTPDESRHEIRTEIEQRYTAPA